MQSSAHRPRGDNSVGSLAWRLSDSTSSERKAKLRKTREHRHPFAPSTAQAAELSGRIDVDPNASCNAAIIVGFYEIPSLKVSIIGIAFQG